MNIILEEPVRVTADDRVEIRIRDLDSDWHAVEFIPLHEISYEKIMRSIVNMSVEIAEKVNQSRSKA